MRVLIPTDFSRCAESAMRYALEWAKRQPSSIYMYHRLSDQPDDWNVKVETTAAAEINLSKAAERVKYWFEVFSGNGIPVRLMMSGGDIASYVQKYVNELSIDVIFMGTRGRSKQEGEHMGSNTLAVLASNELHVVVAKESVGEFEMNEVVFASSFDKRARIAFPYVLDFVRPFMPELHLLNIEVPRFISSTRFITVGAMNDFKKLAVGFKVVTHFHKDRHIGKGIVEFCDELGADMIAFSESSQSFFTGRRMAKEVKYLVEHANQPVFFVHDLDEAADANSIS